MQTAIFRVVTFVTIFFAAFASGSADAQVMRCENLVFPAERINCYYYRAAAAGGPSCLFCAPQIQKPVKRAKVRRVRR